MIITLRPLGTLQTYFSGSRIEIDCPPSTTYADICDIIDVRWGRHLPPQLWDAKTKRFVGGVLVMIDGKDIDQHETHTLSDGQEVHILIPFSGGN